MQGFPDNLSSSPVVSEVHVAQSLVFCVVFCRSLFFLLCLFLLLLHCFSSFELKILMTPLLSLKLSYTLIFLPVSICSKIVIKCLSNCKEGQIAHTKIYKIFDTQQEYTGMSKKLLKCRIKLQR